MSCDISQGRTEPCKDVVGGIKNIYFANYGSIDSFTMDGVDTDVIDGFNSTGSIVGYKYELKGGNSLEQNLQSSRENGTTFVEQTLTAVLKKQDVATHKQVKLIAMGRPRVVVEDYNGNFFMMGLEHGAELTTAAITTGVAMGDLVGYTLTIVAYEKIPCNFIDATSTTIEASPYFDSVVTS